MDTAPPFRHLRSGVDSATGRHLPGLEFGCGGLWPQ